MSTSRVLETAAKLAHVIPSVGLLLTEPIPETLRDSRSQLIMLQMLHHRKAATVSEMAAAMGIAVPTTSTMVRRMVEKGLLVRNRDQEDWRSVQLSLSAEGKEFLRGMTQRRAQAAARLLRGLSDSELRTICEALEILEQVSITAPDSSRHNS